MTVQAGDIVLFRVSSSSNWLDKAIGWGQKKIHQAPTTAEYCHVGIIGDDAEHMWESRWPKITNSDFELYEIQKNLIVEVYRVKDATPEEIAGVLAYCRSREGEWYPVTSIISFGLVSFGDAPYCSLLAWKAWLNGAKRVLCGDGRMVTPDDIAASTELVRVEL